MVLPTLYLGQIFSHTTIIVFFFLKKKPWERQHHGSTHVEFILSTNVQTLCCCSLACCVPAQIAAVFWIDFDP